MPTYIKHGGSWKDVLAVYVKQGGVWKSANDLSVKHAGTWKSALYVPGSTSITSDGTFTVPAGVSTLTVVVSGGGGGNASGDGGRPGYSGGYGAKVTATVAVTPGQSFNIYVGAAGTYGNNSGSGSPGVGGSSSVAAGGGGGWAGPSGSSGHGGGGGGASGFYTGSTPIIIAGGGGGSGGSGQHGFDCSAQQNGFNGDTASLVTSLSGPSVGATGGNCGAGQSGGCYEGGRSGDGGAAGGSGGGAPGGAKSYYNNCCGGNYERSGQGGRAGGSYYNTSYATGASLGNGAANTANGYVNISW
jgi:hypothetical protein